MIKWVFPFDFRAALMARLEANFSKSETDLIAAIEEAASPPVPTLMHLLVDLSSD